MARTGIDNPWRPEDQPDPEPEPLYQWINAGIPAEEAETWRNWRYRIPEATAWRQAGVPGGLQAAQWSTAGVTAATVDLWRAAGIDATEAVTWNELGYSLEQAKQHKANGLTPNQAFDRRRSPGPSAAASFTAGAPRPRQPGGRPLRPPHIETFMRAGVDPRVMHSYMARQWFDDTALTWAKEGIEASEAQLWQELGLKPAEASRLTRQGATVWQTVRDWWGAGIPLDEVAEWIGAGLKPEEAADQRARGITAEQAATLRALRDEP